MCDHRNNDRSNEFDSTREVYNQNKQVAWFYPVEVRSLKCFHWQYLITVRAISWMPDLTVFCPLFSWLKWHFKMPPARILQSGVLLSKVVNAFSVLTIFRLEMSAFSSWNNLRQTFFILPGTVSQRNLRWRQLSLYFFFFETINILERQDTIII